MISHVTPLLVAIAELWLRVCVNARDCVRACACASASTHWEGGAGFQGGRAACIYVLAQ